MGYRVAVVGATGNVGREILAVLAERGFPADEVIAVASERSAGQEVSFGEDDVLRVHDLSKFDFRGIDLHSRQRGLISSIYRPDFLESVSLDEMRAQTLRELHALGYLDPEVTIDVRAADTRSEEGSSAGASDPDPDGDGDRVVVIEARGGRRIRPAEPRIEGIDEDAAAAVAARFLTTLSRVELALGDAVAENRLTKLVSAWPVSDELFQLSPAWCATRSLRSGKGSSGVWRLRAACIEARRSATYLSIRVMPSS